MPTQYLCDIEHHRRTVSARKAKEFSKILGYSPEQFVALTIQDLLDHDGIQMVVGIKKA